MLPFIGTSLRLGRGNCVAVDRRLSRLEETFTAKMTEPPRSTMELITETVGEIFARSNGTLGNPRNTPILLDQWTMELAVDDVHILLDAIGCHGRVLYNVHASRSTSKR